MSTTSKRSRSESDSNDELEHPKKKTKHDSVGSALDVLHSELLIRIFSFIPLKKLCK